MHFFPIAVMARARRHWMVLLLAMALVPGAGMPRIEAAGAGPLFLQVHYTSELEGITAAQFTGLLTGRVRDFRDLGGAGRPLRLAVDRTIAPALHKAHPSCPAVAAPLDPWERLAGDRSLALISDARGLRPYFKTLAVDGTLPWGTLDRSALLRPARPYPITLRGAEAWQTGEHLTLLQTGTTALTRAMIPAVERAGDILSPIRHTRDITRAADLAVASNEVSFLEPCVYPFKDRMSFCSPRRFFTILEESGFDVIELTGNHNNDYGTAPNRDTIGLIEKAGMGYYGGGRNIVEARRVLVRTVRERTIGFVGFNEWGPPAAWATADAPGALRLTRELFDEKVREAVSKADIAVVALQSGNENDPVPSRAQHEYFRRAAELGAAIIISSSAHRAMGIEFTRGRLILYGLGNFLFDQMQSLNHRRGLIARHHFYGRRHIATELIPYQIYDYHQPRLLRGAEARQFMEQIFRLSEGPVFRQ